MLVNRVFVAIYYSKLLGGLYGFIVTVQWIKIISLN